MLATLVSYRECTYSVKNSWLKPVGQTVNTELQIRGGIEDNSKIIFLISQ